jgi:hypothetical protein
LLVRRQKSAAILALFSASAAVSPRIGLLQEILAKCGEVGGLPPELAARRRRYAPLPPARPPTPEEREPARRPRQGRQRERNLGQYLYRPPRRK